MTYDLEGRVALVTGGTRGIGRAIARRLRDAGAQVAVCGRTAPGGTAGSATTGATGAASTTRAPGATSTTRAPGATSTTCAAGALPGGITFFPCDVRDPDAVGALFERLDATYGRLDVLVNNAGGSPCAEAATASPRFSRAIIELNLLAPLYCAQAANAMMQRRPEGGVIVNIGSVSGERPSPGTAAYGAAKAGLSSLTRSLAAEWAPRVRVNCVVVGLVRPEGPEASAHYGDDAAQRALAGAIPMGRLATPDEIADPVLFLASPGARYITGADLQVHGGGERPPHLQAAKSRADHPKVN
ncbi:SDR family oxidoreductase [Streptomyces humicola]|uniref:SDR family oxidoreductase n=1 Tax=Streptomyces humicola TaxID=2953240 RepID=UPI0027E39018|nr:SDR family oxidoreductase [Streptomyces humicola]